MDQISELFLLNVQWAMQSYVNEMHPMPEMKQVESHTMS